MDETVLLYEKILQHLRDEISKGGFLPGDRLPTEMELAKEFGVSRITSKRALEELRAEGLIYRVRGRGSFVAESKPMDAASKKVTSGLDYDKVISFVIPFGCSNGGIMNVVKGASKVMSDRGYILDIKYSNDNVQEERRLLESLYERGTGGIILYPVSDRKNLELMNTLRMDEYPIVTIDKYYESVPISYVVSDNQEGEYEATKYLISLGHRKIAFVSDNRIEDATSVRNRYFGYCRALKESGIPLRTELVKNGDFRNLELEASLPILREMLDAGVTAFCCINDYLASHVLNCLNHFGVEVPKSVSVIGFDDLDICDACYVPITSVRQDMEKMGECAARYVIEKIEAGKYTYLCEVIPTCLVKRESCAEWNE